MIFATITLVIGWWIIPTIITLFLLCFLIPRLFSKNGDGYFGILDLLIVSATMAIGGISWAIYLALRVIFSII